MLRNPPVTQEFKEELAQRAKEVQKELKRQQVFEKTIQAGLDKLSTQIQPEPIRQREFQITTLKQTIVQLELEKRRLQDDLGMAMSLNNRLAKINRELDTHLATSEIERLKVLQKHRKIEDGLKKEIERLQQREKLRLERASDKNAELRELRETVRLQNDSITKLEERNEMLEQALRSLRAEAAGSHTKKMMQSFQAFRQENRGKFNPKKVSVDLRLESKQSPATPRSDTSGEVVEVSPKASKLGILKPISGQQNGDQELQRSLTPRSTVSV